jgi:hypothetical protein
MPLRELLGFELGTACASTAALSASAARFATAARVRAVCAVLVLAASKRRGCARACPAIGLPTAARASRFRPFGRTGAFSGVPNISAARKAATGTPTGLFVTSAKSRLRAPVAEDDGRAGRALCRLDGLHSVSVHSPSETSRPVCKERAGDDRGEDAGGGDDPPAAGEASNITGRRRLLGEHGGVTGASVDGWLGPGVGDEGSAVASDSCDAGSVTN